MMSDFDRVSHQDLAESHVFPDIKRGMTIATAGTVNPQSRRPLVHEIACGGDEAIKKPVDMGTDVMNLVQRENAGCNTARVQTKD